MQRTTKLDQPAPIQELFPSDQILEEVKMEESGIHPHHEDLHAFVTNMWNTTSQPKSGTATSSEDSKEEVLRWHEENFKVQEEEIRRRKEEVLQARAINKNLERLHRRDKRDLTRANREIDELRRSNISLWEELEDVLSMKRTLDLQQREDQLKMTKVVRERDDLRQTNTTLLKELSAVRAAQKLLLSKKKEEPERSTPPAGILRHKMPRTVSWHKDVDEINYGSEAASCLDDDDLSTLSRKDPLEIVELVRSCLTGTVSRWVKGMQTACNPETVEGLVLPWLLHKLFDLTSQAVRKRRDELLYYFEGGNKADLREAPVGFGHATAHESVVHRRVLSHQLALSGDKLKSTVDTIMISLAHRYEPRPNDLPRGTRTYYEMKNDVCA